MSLKPIAFFIITTALVSNNAVSQDKLITKEFDFNFEPTGKNTLYYSYKGDAKPDIFINNGKEEINLSHSPETWDIEPDYSPDGTKIIYSSGPSMANMNLRIMNADGSNIKEFYQSNRTKVGADWSPDGKKILFSAIDPETRDADIMVINSDGSGVKNLTEDFSGTSTSPSWSPDGKKIIFINKPSNDGQQDIYTMNANGGNKTRLTDTEITKRGPVFTPDGRVIIYAGAKTEDDLVHLYAISAQNPEKKSIGRQLTYGNSSEYLAAFTPNGIHMTYSTGDWTKGFKMDHQPIPTRP
ncbi:MAG: PD40 domain-containing protein [Kordiimonadaceae bacterium]|nr:PD40 domain-containing protein [Kordiimonadaceae bacterium]